MKRTLLSISLALFAMIALVGGGVALSQGGPVQPSDVSPIKAEDMQTCMDCHQDGVDTLKAVNREGLKKSPHKDLTCQDCHAAVDGAPHKKEMISEKAACGNCHTDQAEAYAKCSHAKPDKVKGDHPTCVNCHSDTAGGQAIRRVKRLPREDRALLCSSCHWQKDRMSRYGVDTEAVDSYNDSFQGSAQLKFHYTRAAICSDCHGEHTVLPSSNPLAATYRSNGDKVCSKPECHPGANVNFAMSGANHLRLKLKENAVLAGIDIFFKALVLGVIAFMLVGIGLDLRTKVFGKTAPKSGKPIGVIIALSFGF